MRARCLKPARSASLAHVPTADERVSSELKTNIMKARLEKKLTQAQLAQQINELPKIVQDYEAGKAIPNQAVRTPTPRKSSSMKRWL